MQPTDTPQAAATARMCDNVCVVRAGRLVKKLSKDELSQEEIMKYAAGGIE